MNRSRKIIIKNKQSKSRVKKKNNDNVDVCCVVEGLKIKIK